MFELINCDLSAHLRGTIESFDMKYAALISLSPFD